MIRSVSSLLKRKPQIAPDISRCSQGEDLYFDGQTAGLRDQMLIEHEANAWGVILFHRKAKYKHPGAAFGIRVFQIRRALRRESYRFHIREA